MHPERLKPLRVPWMIAPSTPQLGLCMSEYRGTNIEFVGYFAPEEALASEGASMAGGRAIHVVMTEAIPDPEDERSPYQLVHVSLAGCAWARVCTAASDREVIPEEAYDWQLVEGRMQPGEAIASWLAQCHRVWRATGIYPDSNAYEVLDSRWVAETEAWRWQGTHFLFVGEDLYIEALAQRFSWESKGRVHW